MIPLAILALLTLQDPANDALGDGTLTPPTAAIHSSIDPYDIREFSVLAEESLGFAITMGSLSNPLELPYGFSFPIIEVYFGDGDSGANALLPGSGMQLAEGESWRYAFRLTGDGVRLYTADLEGNTADITRTAGLELSTLGNTITVRTPLPRPESLEIYAITGMYSPFSSTGWQPLSREAAPWAFSGEAAYPVLDVLASTSEGQQSALATGILSPIRTTRVQEPWNPWLTVMLGGVVIAFLGVGGRIVAGRQRVQPALVVAVEAPDAPPTAEPSTAEATDPAAAPGVTLSSADVLVSPMPDQSLPENVSETASLPADPHPLAETPLPGLTPPPTAPPPPVSAAAPTVEAARRRPALDIADWDDDEPDAPLWDDGAPQPITERPVAEEVSPKK
jgi:hypothetical protein